MKKSRLVMVILATSLEEIGIAVFVLLGLPRMGVVIPLGGLVAILAGLATYSVVSYRFGLRAMLRKPTPGLADMEGMRGKVTETLSPTGTVRVGSELWQARTEDTRIEVNTEIIVVRRQGLRLIVERCDANRS